MVKTEYYKTREDGVVLVRSYSDSGMKIQQDGTGAIYDEAIDPESMGRIYTETDIPIDHDDEEGTAEEVVNILLGGAE